MKDRLGELILYALVLLVFFMTSIAFAEHKQINPNVDSEKERCLFEILRSPVTKLRYPNLLEDNFFNDTYDMLKQIDSFCSCSVSKRENEIKQRKNDQLSWRFRDKKDGLAIEDQCALKNFKTKTMELFYDVVLIGRFKTELEEKLNQRIGSATRALASDFSVHSRVICLESKIIKYCSRIKSLRSTYHCLEETSSDANLIEKISSSCPDFVERSNERLAGNNISI